MYHQCFKMVNKISNINLQFMNTKAYSKYYCFFVCSFMASISLCVQAWHLFIFKEQKKSQLINSVSCRWLKHLEHYQNSYKHQKISSHNIYKSTSVIYLLLYKIQSCNYFHSYLLKSNLNLWYFNLACFCCWFGIQEFTQVKKINII